ncbi:MAG: zf-HC2 domain-containing protein, partial [Longimicrobiales bacterium]
MNATTCEHVLDRLPDLAGGRIEGPDADALRAHLEACPECREAWSVVSLLAEAEPTPVPAGLEARLQAAVRADRA